MEREHLEPHERGQIPALVCRQCLAVHRRGKWLWARVPENAEEQTCPACLRIRDDQPAATVTLSGQFAETHGEELVGVARGVEARTNAKDALQRIMGVAIRDDGVLITSTDALLARAIGEALHDAYGGELVFHEQDGVLQVRWQR